MNDFFEHQDEREALRKRGLGTQTIIAQRRAHGAGYVHVRDWCELDGYAFRCNTSRPLACVLLSLYAFKRAACVQASHEELADMMGVFGKLCSGGTIRNAVAELEPLGLDKLPYCKHYPEGFRCRLDRKDAGEEERRLREWREADPLYVLRPGSVLARIVEAVINRRAGRKRFTRLPSDRNLSGIGISLSEKYQRKTRAPHAPATVNNSPNAPTGKSTGGSVRPSAAHSTARPSAAHSTARPSAAPEKAAIEEGGPRRSVVPANPRANGPARPVVRRSEAPASRRTPPPSDPPEATPALRPWSSTPDDLVRELLALDLSAPPEERAARLAELEAQLDPY